MAGVQGVSKKNRFSWIPGETAGVDCMVSGSEVGSIRGRFYPLCFLRRFSEIAKL